MNNTMDLSTSDQLERLSAFLDGELSESEFDSVLDSLDDSCCAELKSYQVIGDVMRDSSLAISTSDLFSVRLAKALEAEPAHSLEELQEESQATGTYGAVSSVSPPKGPTAQVHHMPSKPKARLAFVAGGVAAAFATIVTYSIFQSSEIQPGIDSTVPVLASTEVRATAPAVAPEVVESPVLAATAASNLADSTQSFSRAPTVAVRASAANAHISTEERRRTYPEYLRSHSDMSAHTPFMQVNYQGLGVGQ